MPPGYASIKEAYKDARFGEPESRTKIGDFRESRAKIGDADFRESRAKIGDADFRECSEGGLWRRDSDGKSSQFLGQEGTSSDSLKDSAFEPEWRSSGYRSEERPPPNLYRQSDSMGDPIAEHQHQHQHQHQPQDQHQHLQCDPFIAHLVTCPNCRRKLRSFYQSDQTVETFESTAIPTWAYVLAGVGLLFVFDKIG
ncbi:MAG: hypothetical protein ACYCOU_15040 [Sulfobacillus sp.]